MSEGYSSSYYTDPGAPYLCLSVTAVNTSAHNQIVVPSNFRIVNPEGRVVFFRTVPDAALLSGEFGLEEPSGWIERFGIDPDHRGHDLGRRMFAAMVDHFRAGGARSVRTLADRNDAGITGFLRALGLTPSPLEALEMRLDAPAREGR